MDGENIKSPQNSNVFSRCSMNVFHHKSSSPFHLYKAIFSNSTVGMAVCDFSGQCLDVNDEMCRMVGAKREQVLAQNFNALDSWKQSGLLEATLAAIREKTEKHHELTVSTSFGKTITINYHIIPFVAEDQEYLLFIFNDITKRKQTAVALKESERRYESFVENFHGIAFRGSMNFVPEFFHGAVEEITGYTEEDFLAGSPSWDQIIVPEDLPAVMEDAKQVSTQANFSSQREYRIATKDGQVRWVGETIQNVCDESGMPIYVEGAIYNITERKKAEEELKRINEKLRHSHELLHYVISHARSAIAVHDTELNYIYVSDRYLEEYNVKGENIIGRHHYEVFPDLPQKWRDVHQRCLKGEVLSAEEDPYYREDGSVDWTRWECRPWYELDGTIGGIIVYTEVITERKRVEERLRKSEEQLQLAIEGSELGLWDWNIQTGETFFNDKYFSMLGYRPDEHPHTKETWERLLHPEDKAAVFKVLDASIKNDKSWNLEFRLQTKKGDYKWILGRGKVVEKDVHGIPLRASGTHLDISDNKRAEEDLLKMQKLESTGILAGGIAHDFNNILTAILGNVNLALLDSQLTPKTQKLLNEAEKASLRARDLTQQLLTFSKGGEPIKEAASLKEVVQDSAEFVLHGEKSKAKYRFSDDLWLAEIDKGQISQVVQNIILNANQAMPDGGTIEINCENFIHNDPTNTITLHAGKYIKLSIKDCGAGIPANMLGRIFDPYFSTKQKGSGLGLAITHSIIRKHNGHIQVESSPGCGSTFTIFLPVSVQKPRAIQQEKAIDSRTAELKIMIMDDEEQVRCLSQAMLASMGHETILAKDGEEALALYKQAMDLGSPVDLAIMDLTIPGGMGGKEAIKKILSIDQRAKVIVSSGYSTDPIMADYNEYGFCGALVKPYRLKDLVRAINDALEESATDS